MYMHYQPIIDTYKQSTIGYESFVRGENGEKSKAIFERFALEKNIPVMDTTLMAQSIQEGSKLLQDAELLFINVHPKTLECEKGISLLEDVPPDRIVLEITEKSRLTRQVIRNLNVLSNSGVRFAVDDFGREHSNLDRFLHAGFCPTFIKLDRIFSASLALQRTRIVIRHLLRLCKELNMKMIIEGVETQDQHQELDLLDVRYRQGYFYGRPKPAHSFTT